MPPMGGPSPMGGMPSGPPGLGLGGPQGQINPNDPLLNPNMDPTLGPASMGGQEPDEASLEQLISILKVLGVGGGASGMQTGPQGQGLPLSPSPGDGMMGGPGAGLPMGAAGPMMPPGAGSGLAPGMMGGGSNPLISALGGGAARGF